MNDLIPDGWEEIQLGNISSLITKGTTPKKYSTVGVNFVKVESVSASSALIPSKFAYIDVATHEGLKRSQLKNGDILFSIAGSLGRLAIVNTHHLPANTNQALAIIRLKKDHIDIGFCIQQLKGETIQSELKNLQTVGAQPNLSLHQISNIVLKTPPLPEQQKIAAILTSVDEVIEKTQAQIDKLKDLKTGIMQTLLTRGVGIDGKPHTEFKDSPVGRIPKGWDCILLDKVAKRGSGHTPDKQRPEYWNEGIKWVSLTDSSKLDNLYIDDTAKKISQLGIENSSANMHPKGTVVMARDAGIGKSAIITDSMAVSQHFMAWVCGEKLNNYFLYYLLQLWKPKFEVIAMGSTIKTIGLPYFKKLQIPVPPITEQNLIACTLKSVDRKIFALQRKHSSLKDTKKALMQDLLTGKVRVTVPSESVGH